VDTKQYTIRGFKGSAVRAGLKKNRGLDLALIYSEKEAVAAGVFTTNKVKAAPVIYTKQTLSKGKARAIIANSGNANACTGEQGLNDARQTALLVARELGIEENEVLVASTGVIGQPLTMELVAAAIPGLVKDLSPGGLPRTAQAILTTDSFPKISRFDGKAGGCAFGIVGLAKGAGMIMPNMATMLSFVVTDIRIEESQLREALSSCVEKTFNRISVDGDTSTNDMVLVLANGAAGNKPLTGAEMDGFKAGLNHVAQDLAHMIVKDGEGATKVVHVRVRGAAHAADARKASRTVANSSLVKTAFYGQDPNWGRIMAALGRAPITLEPDRVDIWIDDVLIVERGMGKGAEAEEEAARKMQNAEFALSIDLHQGAHEDHILTCDLTHEYVSINADYRT